MPFNKSEIKKILVVSLSNLGDVILTFPVIDILKENFPKGDLSVVVGPKAVSLFAGNPNIKKVYVFQKSASNLEKLRWVLDLRKEHFDLIVDLRNTAIPFFIGAKYRTSFQRTKFKGHMRLKHLNCLKSVFACKSESTQRYALLTIVPQNTENMGNQSSSTGYHNMSLEKKMPVISDVKEENSLVVVSPGAANHLKRWTQEGFAAVCDQLVEKYQKRVVLVGDEADQAIAESIRTKMRSPAINLAGELNLTQLAELLSRASLVVANDSGVMHMASYLDRPVVAIFAPTDPQKYGPWSSKSLVVYRPGGMNEITAPEVLEAIEKILKP